VSIVNNGGNGYAALHFSQTQGYVPPDTNGAAGPTNYVETVNQTLAIYNPKDTGASSVTDTFSDFWFVAGGLPHADAGSGLSDPVVNYDDVIGRFVVGDQDVDFSTHVSRFDIAVSTSNSPANLTTDWKFYSIVTTETGRDADYPGNFGFNHDAVVFTLNMFNGAARAQVISISQADLAAGMTNPAVFHNDVADFSLRPTAIHDGVANGPMFLVTEHGDHHSIDVITMTNVLSSSASFVFHNLAVTPYSTEIAPKNPNGTTVTTNIDSRIQKSSERNNILMAAHSVGVSTTEDDIQWYQIDVSNPSAPSLTMQGRVGFGTNTYLTYPAIEINTSSQIGMTYMKQGNDTSSDFVSMYVTGRNPGDASGTMETPVLVPAGTGVANYKDFTSGGRSGDLGGINVDPVDNTTFWAANEFANMDPTANWGTAVANFTLGTPLPPVDMAVSATGPSSVTAGTDATYVVNINNFGPNDAQGVVLSDLPPAGSSLVSIMQTGGTDAFTQGGSGGTVTETANGIITNGSSDQFTIVVFAPTSLANGAPFNDTATVSSNNPDPNPSNNSFTVMGTVVNNGAMSDLSLTVAGASSSLEGNKVKYTITVKNNGPNDNAGVVATDQLGSLLKFVSATASQGTFSQSNGVVTFNIGSMANGATVTLTVTGQALEDGSTSDSASVTGNDSDPNPNNNNASKTTNFTEAAIVVSAPITTTQTTLTNFQVAHFTHANGVEPAGNFLATINWGDGSSSQGTITKVGNRYNVTGSHTYNVGGSHTITTTVVETGQAVDKGEDEKPGDDIVHLPFGSNGTDSATFAVSQTPLSTRSLGDAGWAAWLADQAFTSRSTQQFFSPNADGLAVFLGSQTLQDWTYDLWLSEINS
jgi:uncharacterized repeat protein (TIGR01451 family)